MICNQSVSQVSKWEKKYTTCFQVSEYPCLFLSSQSLRLSTWAYRADAVHKGGLHTKSFSVSSVSAARSCTSIKVQSWPRRVPFQWKSFVPLHTLNLIMADARVQVDVEQAPGKQSSDDASRPPRADGHPQPPDPMNNIADKVVVLSFRNLQLRRIGDLQDKLIALSMAKQPLHSDHADRVDQALRAYGV